MKKTLLLLLLLPISFVNSSCNNNLPQIETTVREVSSPAFGNVNFELTHEQFLNAGFDYNDLVEVTFHNYDGSNKDASYEVAYVTNFNEVGYYAPCICNYEDKGEYFDFAFGMSHIKENSSSLVGKKVTIKMKKKHGYASTHELVNVSRKLSLEELGGDKKAFSNFRDVSSIGKISSTIKEGRIYRGSSPYNSHGNPDGRHEIADDFIGEEEIQTEVALTGTDDEIAEQMEARKREKSDSYTCKLYEQSEGQEEFERSFYSKDLGTDYFTQRGNSNEEEKKGGDLTKDIFTYIANHCGDSNANAPIYIHCNEGKDRTGFFLMVLEALAGVSLDDIIADFMLTFKNYYGVSPEETKEKYDALANLTVYRHIYSILIDDPTDNLEKVQWYDFDAKKEVENILGDDSNKLQELAEKYLEETIHVGSDEVENIRQFLISQE